MSVLHKTAFQSDANSVPHQEKMEQSTTIQYQVKNRDSLRSIAVQYNTTTSKIMKLNKLASNLIFPGQVLNVPKSVEDIPSSCVEPTSSFDDQFAFLAPLSVSSAEKPPIENFIMDPFLTSPVQRSNSQGNSYSFEKVIDLTSLKEEAKKKPPVTTPPQKLPSPGPDRRRSSSTRDRIISSDSSERFEENFIKMDVFYITPAQETVEGVLLITPTSVMFDPSPLDPLAIQYGCDKFGIMCNMSSIVSATMFSDKGELPMYITDGCSSPSPKPQSEDPVTPPTDNLIDFGEVVTSEPTSLTDNSPQDDSKVEDEDAESHLMREFPLLYSIAKTVGGMIPGTRIGSDADNPGSSPMASAKSSMFFCVRSKLPMMRTFSKNQEIADHSDEKDAKAEEQSKSEDKLNESWFKIPKSKSDHLLAFFMQWTPDQHTLDFAEQNGFVVTNQMAAVDGSLLSKAAVGDESRERSSTNASLEFVDDFFSDARIEKEWEILSIEEAKRRSTLGALELANDDTSLMPEVLDSSNLLNDATILSLCKNLPARCVGCPWKLLYSTFEHGMSLRTLYRRTARLSDSDSPVLIVVQDTEGYKFGAVTSCAPQVSEHFLGTGESFLFTLEPTLQVFGWTGENMFFLKGHTDSLTIGGGDGLSGLWLDGDLCHGSSHPCLTFNNTLLSSTQDFFIQGVEVWTFQNN